MEVAVGAETISLLRKCLQRLPHLCQLDLRGHRKMAEEVAVVVE